MPVTSLIWTTRLVPSFSRCWWMTRSTALDTCSRIARTGSSTPAMSTIVSSRERLSRGLFAWTVVMDPS